MGWLFPDENLKREINRLLDKQRDLENKISFLNHRLESKDRELTTREHKRLEDCFLSSRLRCAERDRDMYRASYEKSQDRYRQLCNEYRDLRIKVDTMAESLRICCNKKKKGETIED